MSPRPASRRPASRSMTASTIDARAEPAGTREAINALSVPLSEAPEEANLVRLAGRSRRGLRGRPDPRRRRRDPGPRRRAKGHGRGAQERRPHEAEGADCRGDPAHQRDGRGRPGRRSGPR